MMVPVDGHAGDDQRASVVCHRCGATCRLKLEHGLFVRSDPRRCPARLAAALAESRGQATTRNRR